MAVVHVRPPADVAPEEAVIAEARAVIGDLTIVFCAGCIREAAVRMADGA
jgi:hypothetical protein